ncbi:MAG: hypothetical protein R3C53_03585 [Pirellulaceae bacterium]
MSASDENSASQDASSKEPSLGPACLVVSILLLAVFSSVCGFGSWIVFSDQYAYAEKGINKQLIPWVESSQLAPADKQSILEQLRDLVPRIANQEISKEQLLRLRNCLQDNPVCLWGNVQSIVAQAPQAGLTEVEQQALQRLNERLLRMAAERKLSRSDLEQTMRELTEVRQDLLSVEVRDNLTAAQIRSFMKNAENLANTRQDPNIGFDKTPAETFALMVKEALDVP